MDPQHTMEKLSEQIETVEKRAKKIDADMKRHLGDALAKKKAGDQRGKCVGLIGQQQIRRGFYFSLKAYSLPGRDTIPLLNLNSVESDFSS